MIWVPRKFFPKRFLSFASHQMASLTTAAVRQSLHGLRTRVNALPVLRGTTGSGHLGRVPRLLSTTEAPPALADSESSSSCADWNSARLEINGFCFFFCFFELSVSQRYLCILSSREIVVGRAAASFCVFDARSRLFGVQETETG